MTDCKITRWNMIRQMIECVVVESKEKIKVAFIGGTEIEMVL